MATFTIDSDNLQSILQMIAKAAGTGMEVTPWCLDEWVAFRVRNPESFSWIQIENVPSESNKWCIGSSVKGWIEEAVLYSDLSEALQEAEKFLTTQ